MDLRLLIRSVECRKADNYFAVIQYEEVVFPSKRMRCEKFRTNICAHSSGPRFTKNVFLFENVGLGNRLTLKIALFSTTKVDESQPVEELIVGWTKQRESIAHLRRAQSHADAAHDHALARQPQGRPESRAR